ncbi:MAG: M81 family metallopeptidase, partial [Candidatus Eremiobacteraeota bacterium]|nr:M81 family metallopeptidase [Candidatus Eremiobacteraeota bacterium]
MRVLVACITQETNTFCTLPTTRAEFEKQGLFFGRDLVNAMQGTGTVTAGFLDVARERGWDVVPVVFAYALPGGLVERGVLDELLATVLAALEKTPDLDGILLHLHGATVAGELDDPEATILRAIRARIGGELPLICCLDLHANVSAEMVANATVLVGYDTYPHVDFYERGRECGTILARIFAGELRPATAFVHPPLLPPLQKMVTSTPSTIMARLFATARDLEADPRVVDVSIFGGFPYADVPDAGFSVVVTTNGDAALARHLAERVVREAWERRSEWLVELTPPAR